MPARYPFATSDFQKGRIDTYGKVWFVDSAHPQASNSPSHGAHPGTPWSTMHYANSRLGLESPVRTNLGDVVVVAPRHVETVTAAAGLVLDVAGVKWFCPMAGRLMAQINFTTAVGADCNIDAANIWLENFRFTGGIDALTGPIDINAAYCVLKNILTEDVTGQVTDFIVTDANADNLLISGWRHLGAAAVGADTAITIVGGDNITIEDFWIDGNFAVACIENVTTAAVNLSVGGGHRMNYARTRNAADVIFTAVATTTGNVGPNIFARLQDNAANITEAFVGAAMQFYTPIGIVNADGERSLDWNGTQSADV